MKTFVLFFLQLFFFTATGQEVSIDGALVNSKGETVSRASIQVMNSKNATMANNNGQFHLVVKKGDSLRITRVGYSEFHYGVTKSGEIKIQLNESSLLASANGKTIYFSVRPIIEGKIISERLTNLELKNDASIANKSSGEIRIFQKVEILPVLRAKAELDSVFLDHLKGKKEGTFTICFIIAADKTIDNVRILKSFDKS
jgi:hypothetical protein